MNTNSQDALYLFGRHCDTAKGREGVGEREAQSDTEADQSWVHKLIPQSP